MCCCYRGCYNTQLGTHRTCNNGTTLNGTTPINLGVIGTSYAASGIRLKTTNPHSIVFLNTARIIADTGSDYIWEIQSNPTITGGLTYTNMTNSPVQYGIGSATTIVTAAGDILSSGFGSGKTVEDLKISNLRQLGSSLAGVYDQLVLVLRPFAVNLKVNSALGWDEL